MGEVFMKKWPMGSGLLGLVGFRRFRKYYPNQAIIRKTCAIVHSRK
jgi:hypothetical protein